MTGKGRDIWLGGYDGGVRWEYVVDQVTSCQRVGATLGVVSSHQSWALVTERVRFHGREVIPIVGWPVCRLPTPHLLSLQGLEEHPHLCSMNVSNGINDAFVRIHANVCSPTGLATPVGLCFQSACDHHPGIWDGEVGVDKKSCTALFQQGLTNERGNQ